MFDFIAALGLSTLLFVLPPVNGGTILAQNSLSLTNRSPHQWVNEVYTDNIILTLHYAKGDAGKPIDWAKIKQPFDVKFSLKPGETFAFQGDVLPEFEGKVVKTTNATFNGEQGFRSSGWLMGDGICHLASFINLTAKEAGLSVLAPTKHNFAPIPDIPYEFGTSIFYMPGNIYGNAHQNLYIINNFSEEVNFIFVITPEKITLTISNL